LIPRNIDINISDLVGKTKLLPNSRERMLEENEDTIYKLNSVSSTISEISKSYKDVAATTVEEEVVTDNIEKNKELFIDELINNIENMSDNMLYEDIIQIENGITEEIFEKLMDKEEIHMQDILEIFESHNCYIVGLDDIDIRKHVEEDIMQMCKAINHTFKISKLNYIWGQKIEENKKTLSNQLDGVSKVISWVADGIIEKNKSKFEKEKEEIEILLLQKNIGVYDINIREEKNGKLIVDLYTKLCDDMIEEASKIQKTEQLLTKVLNQNMEMHKQKNGINGDECKVLQTYISEDKYTLSIGIAKEKKQSSEMSGDSNINMKLDDGKVLVALSDGMGSGKEAKKSSELAIKMIKRLLGAGFEKDVALELINSIIAAKSENDSFATLDISVFDLFTGNIEFIKNAACPTYIKNGKNVEVINAISLPAGILTNVDSVVFDKDIKPGDIIVMCTDGIIEANKEALNKEEWIKELLSQISIDNPQKIADIILKEAIDHSVGITKDDMTVIVAKVSEK
jgi:stage II sporulation protein E